ncbi:hypothetical protein DLJ53_21755 [Acuticoccus sediminis]|uniref:Uncharacterized protein n=1 Tax=Acuticoccus sediminis TaxID=2184697 RepID=A0A8B2NU51_9HYPH|nr:hypothetical protein DLJ53_21755 [Acuticoccus sediminis]
MARAGCSVEELAHEFELCVHTIHGRIRHAELDSGSRSDGAASEEREELRHLRRKSRRLRQERDILSKIVARESHKRAARRASVLSIHDCEPSR